MQYAGVAGVRGGAELWQAVAGGLDAEHRDGFIIEERMKQAIALEPPPMQATSESGSRPSTPALLARLAPITDWKSRTIIG